MHFLFYKVTDLTVLNIFDSYVTLTVTNRSLFRGVAIVSIYESYTGLTSFILINLFTCLKHSLYIILKCLKSFRCFAVQKRDGRKHFGSYFRADKA
jgi:hypothetical protein